MFGIFKEVRELRREVDRLKSDVALKAAESFYIRKEIHDFNCEQREWFPLPLIRFHKFNGQQFAEAILKHLNIELELEETPASKEVIVKKRKK